MEKKSAKKEELTNRNCCIYRHWGRVLLWPLVQKSQNLEYHKYLYLSNSVAEWCWFYKSDIVWCCSGIHSFMNYRHSLSMTVNSVIPETIQLSLISCWMSRTAYREHIHISVTQIAVFIIPITGLKGSCLDLLSMCL